MVLIGFLLRVLRRTRHFTGWNDMSHLSSQVFRVSVLLEYDAITFFKYISMDSCVVCDAKSLDVESTTSGRSVI